MNPINGLIRIDKPAGCTSHDVVNRWRKLASIQRVGHLGTLDPMATGLLLLLSGTATRLARFYNQNDKTYAAELTLGVESDTYDAEGLIVPRNGNVPKDWNVIHKALDAFRGKFLQTPPAVSAKKIRGVPAYKLARQNVEFELKPVEVEVKQLDLVSVEGETLRLVIRCSAGTYIRSIAHDLGRALGCGAILSGLRRLSIAAIDLDGARTLEQLDKLAAENRLAEAVIPASDLLPHLPAQHFGSDVVYQIRQGREFHTSPFVVPAGTPLIRALDSSGNLVALAEIRIPNLYHPKVVL